MSPSDTLREMAETVGSLDLGRAYDAAEELHKTKNMIAAASLVHTMAKRKAQIVEDLNALADEVEELPGKFQDLADLHAHLSGQKSKKTPGPNEPEPGVTETPR